MSRDKHTNAKKTIFWLVAVALMVGCVRQPTIAEMDAADYGPEPADYQQILKNHLEHDLFDPYSAIVDYGEKPWKRSLSRPFREPMFGWGGRITVNAKNRYGGYTGSKTYNYIIKNGAVLAFEEMRY
jgi:hypothetical protein